MQGGVRKRGSSWYYYFDVTPTDGKRKIIERKGGSTKKEAQKSLRVAIAEYEKNGQYKDESDISVVEYFEYWYKEYVLINCKHNTQLYYTQFINNHIRPYFKHYKLKSLNSNILQQFINEKCRTGYSKSSISNFVGSLSKALTMATHNYSFIKINPMENVEIPKFDSFIVNKDDMKVVSLVDFKSIIERFPPGDNFYIPLQLAFNTGMRASEVCGLTWDCVDLNNSIIEVKNNLIKENKTWKLGTPKTQTSFRKILIGDTLLNILKEHKEYQTSNKAKYKEHYTNSDFVCTKENGDLVTTDALKYLSRVINYELKINFNFHSLRHTHATMLLEAGANIKDIQKRLGHTQLATTMDTYSHITDKIKQDSLTQLEKINSELN
jgi:ATP-dependent helicase/nuclease subunit A